MVFKALYVEDVCLCVFPLPMQNVVCYDVGPVGWEKSGGICERVNSKFHPRTVKSD